MEDAETRRLIEAVNTLSDAIRAGAVYVSAEERRQIDERLAAMHPPTRFRSNLRALGAAVEDALHLRQLVGWVNHRLNASTRSDELMPRGKDEASPDVERLAQELYDVAFALNFSLPPWDALPEETRTWLRARAKRMINDGWKFTLPMEY